MPLRTYLDSFDSSQLVLLAFLAIAALGGLLYVLGIVNALVAVSAWVIRGLLRGGLICWVGLLSWLPWPVLLLFIVAAQFFAWFTGPHLPLLNVALGAGLLFIGFTSTMAYMLVDQEQYEVARGYKALHNPGKGQELAGLLLHYGPKCGLPLLLSACLASVTGFAILNSGLYNSIARRWYLVSETTRYQQVTDEKALRQFEQREAGYPDFLAYSLLHLASAVDIIDLANSSKYAHLSYVKPRFWAASALLAAFRAFFTAILVQQLVAWFRGMRLLQDSVRDFWSPNESIQRRAGEALSQQGARAVEHMVRSMEQVESLTREQLEYLPRVLAAIGPSAAGALGRALTHARPEVREVALTALGQLRHVPALGELAAMSTDPAERVRRALAGALAELFADGVVAVQKGWLLKHRLRSRRRWRWPFGRQGPEAPAPGPVEVALPVLLQLLADEALAVRAAAITALGALGPAAAPAMTELASRVEEEDAGLLQHLAQALGEVREPVEEAVAALVHLLDNPVPEVKRAALQALARCGDDASPAVPALLPLLQDSDESIRQAAAEAIGAVGELDAHVIPKLTGGLKHRDNLLRARAAEAIGTIGPPAAAAAGALAAALRDPNDRVREQAAWALGKLGPEASAATEALTAALSDEDFVVAAHAAEALGGLGPVAVSATGALLGALRHLNAEVRRQAAAALARIEAPFETVAAALVALASDRDAAARLTALEALGDLPRASGEVIAALTAALADESPQARQAAVHSLARLGVGADRLAGAFEPLFSDVSLEVRREVARAVGEWGNVPEPLLIALRGALNDSAEEVQLAAAQALARLGPEAAAAEGPLREALGQGSAALREQALRALAAVAPETNLGLFVAALQDAIVEVRRVAAAVLVRTGGALASESVAELVQALKDPDPQVRSNVAQALGRVEAVPPQAVPLLLECASDPDDGLRLLALRAVRPFYEQGAHLWPNMLQDPHPQVAFTAARYVLLADTTHVEAGAVLERALAAETIRDRRQAVEVLEELGPRGAAFLPRVREWRLAETDEDLRQRVDRLVESLAAPAPDQP